MTHLTGFACPPAALRSAYGTPAPLREARLADGQANPVKWVIITAPWYNTDLYASACQHEARYAVPQA